MPDWAYSCQARSGMMILEYAALIQARDLLESGAHHSACMGPADVSRGGLEKDSSQRGLDVEIGVDANDLRHLRTESGLEISNPGIVGSRLSLQRTPRNQARSPEIAHSVGQPALDIQGEGRALEETDRSFRTLNVVDDFTRECVAIEVDTSLSGERVTRVLDRAIEQRGQPTSLVMDNGPELAGRALDFLRRWQGKGEKA